MKTAWLAAGGAMVTGLIAYYAALELIANPVVIYLSWGIPA